jgi:hypothetical protein
LGLFRMTAGLGPEHVALRQRPKETNMPAQGSENPKRDSSWEIRGTHRRRGKQVLV